MSKQNRSLDIISIERALKENNLEELKTLLKNYHSLLNDYLFDHEKNTILLHALGLGCRKEIIEYLLSIPTIDPNKPRYKNMLNSFFGSLISSEIDHSVRDFLLYC